MIGTTNDGGFTVAHFNAQSLLPKFIEVREHILLNDFDILCISETWLSGDILDENLLIDGYSLFRRDRDMNRWGGVCMYIKKSIHCSVIPSSRNIEQLWVNISIKNMKFAIGVIYRAPNSDVKDFFEIFESDISHFLSSFDECLCLGDFNFDFLKPDIYYTRQFISLVDSLNLSQVVDQPTRITSTSVTLDDLILTSNTDLLGSVEVYPFLADHEFIKCTLNVATAPKIPIFKTIRDFKNFNNENFLADLYAIPFHNIFYIHDVNNKLEFFNRNFLQLIDSHAPLRQIRITKKYAPWLTDNIRFLITLRNKALSKWRKSKNVAHYNYYKSLRNYTTLACRKEKKSYFQQRVATVGINKIWRDLKLINMGKKTNDIPESLADPNKINDYYINGVPKLKPSEAQIAQYLNNNRPGVEIFNFQMVTEIEVSRILSKIKSTATGVDGLGINLLKLACPYIVPFVTHIVNCCIEQKVFPNCWKSAVVIPIPKVSNPTTYKDLRPISILPTLSKVLERVMESQLRVHVNNFSILPENQSGFRPDHSCETALLGVTDDILKSLDAGDLAILTLVDFSKAFDTLSHRMLCAILTHIGISGESLELVRSFLQGRGQFVRVSGVLSDTLSITCGVPQGSIMGPLLFSIYTSQFVKAIKFCKTHLYADDTQVYHSFKWTDIDRGIEEINSDLSGLIAAATDHCLTINAKKSSVMVFGSSKLRQENINRISIKVGNDVLPVVEDCRNLGLLLDTNLKYRLHIRNLIRTAYFNLKMLYHSRHYLNKKLKTILCESLVLSRFNYCDTIYGPSLDSIDKRRIQVLQNSCLRLIFGIARREHISHKLLELKWLNMSDRRILHSACLFHKIITTKAPGYLHRKIKFRSDVHNINVRFRGRITPPVHRTERFKTAFSYQVSNVYNGIPDNFKTMPLKSFKFALKKHLFEIKYN